MADSGRRLEQSPGVNPADVLNRAADLYEHGGVGLAKRTWGWAVRGGDACMTEALAEAARQLGWKFKYRGPSNCSCGQCTGDEMAQLAGFTDMELVWAFQDRPGVTKADVIEHLRSAALDTTATTEGVAS